MDVINATSQEASLPVLVKEATPVLGSPTSTSTKADPYANFKPLLVIPSEEGLISQYLRVTGFLEKAKEHNRSLVLFPFVSHHYPDIVHSQVTSGGRIHLCDIFRFPYNLVTCFRTGMKCMIFTIYDNRPLFTFTVISRK